MNWQKLWRNKSVLNWLLLPLSLIFYVLTAGRRTLYKRQWLKVQHAFCPVVIVGNINVGGAGKTPLVIALGQLLSAHNISYAVVSKGYGGRLIGEKIVEPTDSASLVGDEPLLINIKCDCPVVVAKSRIDGCRLIEQHFPNTQIILTDDGLQHYQLYRDIEVCVINHKIGLGNGWTLPSGGLREPPSRLKSVDFLVYNGDENAKYHYILAERGWRHVQRDEKRYPDEFSMNANANLMLSGIAHPDLFFERVVRMGIEGKARALPDHYALEQRDLPADKTLLMTEKDWVKAKDLQHDDAWFLATEAVLSEALKKDFLQVVKERI